MTMRERHVGSFLVLLGTLAFGCVSGGGDDPAKTGPECFDNSGCQGGHECSGGICVGYYGCASDDDCRNNEDCYDHACRIPCKFDDECEDQGLVCGNAQGDTQHCKPAPNPKRGQTQTMSGSGGTGSTGSTGSSGAPTAGSAASAGGAPATAGMSNASGTTGAQTTAGRPGG
jgi:hypothetical protein